MIGLRIRQLRAKESQVSFAKRFGVTRNTIQRYESGGNNPDTGFVTALCKHYCVSADWLITGNGSKNPDNKELAYPSTALTLGEHVDLLAKIHNSGNTVLVKAIDANLHAFSEAIDNKALAQKAMDMMDEMNTRILALETDLTKIKEENQSLKKRIPGDDELQNTG